MKKDEAREILGVSQAASDAEVGWSRRVGRFYGCQVRVSQTQRRRDDAVIELC